MLLSLEKDIMRRGDWRDHLFTIYVDNVHLTTSWKNLRDAFSEFGVVMDIFIASNGRETCRRRSTYTFVKYHQEKELRRAVRFGNKKIIYGYQIVIKKAAYGWKARKRKTNGEQGVSRITSPKPRTANTIRSYKEALSTVRQAFPWSNTPVTAQNPGNRNATIANRCEITLFLLEFDFEWLRRSEIDVLKNSMESSVACIGLSNEAIRTSIRPIRGPIKILAFVSDDIQDKSQAPECNIHRK
ncbi:Uncharacterized protein TCM_032660 [Theobroma cacao]|uniref:RRM domain-containing protein n=1 Tax=Theobroma cacao TaxID=3641 RepID=A0A061FA38_THECC|nr:Uncharacterized protein TCM_032660 [Theobroma cacao]